MFKKVIIKIIKVYQDYFSPLLGHHCRFYPTCSDYMIEVIEKDGLLKGSFRGILRLVRCQPFCRGGIDFP